MAKKSCPRCSRIFTCEGDSDCWCENIQILKKDMVAIMERYNDCLCPDCLKMYEAK